MSTRVIPQVMSALETVFSGVLKDLLRSVTVRETVKKSKASQVYKRQYDDRYE